MQQTVTCTLESLLSETHTLTQPSSCLLWNMNGGIPRTFEGHAYTGINCRMAILLYSMQFNYVTNEVDISSDT